MSHLSSSIRAARTALKYPLIRKSRAYQTLLPQDVFCPHNISRHRHVSTRAIVSAAGSSSLGQMAGCNKSLAGNGMLHYRHDINRRPTFGLTMQNMISSCTTLFDPNDTRDNISGDENAFIAPEKTDGVRIPFQRSKKAKSKVENSGFDDRAQAKLAALSKAKKEAIDAKASYLSSEKNNADDDDSVEELHRKWKTSEEQLALAYSQAIKYTSRITKNEEATKTAERLLGEWMDRFLDPFGASSTWMDDDKEPATDSKAMYLNKKNMVRTINKVVPKLALGQSLSESKPTSSTPTSKGEEGASSALPKIRIPPPSSKDYINLLRAYSMSKAKRKGQQCEFLMRNMMQLTERVAFYYDESGDEWTEDRASDVGMESVITREGKESKVWRLWANDSIPKSKVFSLAIKCHAGTTHSEALERILVLNHIHDAFHECCNSHITGIYQDDPYVLFHSIKALKNLQKKEERGKGHEWLRKLHNFVTSPENVDYFQENEVGDVVSEWTYRQPKESDETDSTTSLPEVAPSRLSQTVDVTSAYTTFIRLLARLRGTHGVAADALKVLERMHQVHDVFENGLTEPGTQTPLHSDETSKNEDPEGLNKRRIAYIDIRSNAYNLVLGLYRDSKKAEDAPKAIKLLQRMIDATTQAPENRKGVPVPSEQSYQFTIMSLANMSDGEKAIREAERLIRSMQDQNLIDPSVSVYNAYITVCNRQLYGKPQLYDKAMGILDEMNRLSQTNSGVSPNPETLALVMKACSLSGHDDHKKGLAAASEIFSQLEERESSEKSALALTDRAYYYMMKCVDMHTVGDPSGKKDRIEELFSGACQRGLCSANVLEIFRSAVSEEDYHLTVGKGRLADGWIANIKGPRALYTDGSRGGAGKHARRKGKSTSGWAKKKKAKDSERETRRKDKKAKKFFKKMTAAS